MASVAPKAGLTHHLGDLVSGGRMAIGDMGFTTATLKLTNPFVKKSITVSALVDTGAIGMCITDAQARQLGFDPEEARKVIVTLADGRQKSVPKLMFIGIDFENRSCSTDAFVLGDQALIGVVPMELMDVQIDPRSQKLIVNPEHPNTPVYLVK